MGEGYSNHLSKINVTWNGADIKYAVNDISSEEYLKVLRQYSSDVEFRTGIKKVIFNGPATIVIWVDGSKTVVKCAEGDGYSKFSGLAIAMCKRMYGTDFKRIFNHFIPKEETKCNSSETTVVEVVRCKDCIHRDPEDKKCDCSFQAKGGIFPMNDDDFCSYGERKMI